MKVDKSVNNDFEQAIVDSGYKWFEDVWRHSIRAFQKRITDERGIKYFITGYHYNLNKQHPDMKHGDVDSDSYSFSVQFRKEKQGKDKTVNIDYSADFLPNKYRPVTKLKEVEAFFEKAWKTLKFDYYEIQED